MTGQLVWLITGAGSGLGKELAMAVLNRGDKVVATTRSVSVSKLDELKALGAATLSLDVEAPLEEIREIAQNAIEIYGQVDVVVNNAAYLLVGTIEDSTPQETYDQFHVNIFGALNVARAFLPHMRERRTGTIVWASSIVGWAAPPATGLYSATKAAIRAVSACLHSEISPLGLRSIAIDYGFYRTNIIEYDNIRFSSQSDKTADYEQVVRGTREMLKGLHGNEPGDSVKAGKVVVDLVRGEGAADGRELPTLIPLGPDTLDVIDGVTNEYTKTRSEWKNVIVSTGY